MTSASAQDRVEQARLLLREALVLREAAEENYLKAYSDFLEAKAVAVLPNVSWPHDERSQAERYADGETARLHRSEA